ncbi:MFS transporter [Planosporangium sp. 12N6]|uniref:MFS transporter n=1 Tax=Planosporangium spinosum TaxID=3402278 RepID=UPI003CF0B716
MAIDGTRLLRIRDSVRDVSSGGGGYLLGATLIQSVGQGTAMACNAVFFVTIIGIPPAEVGVTYSAATLAAMGFALVVGWAADQWGARGVTVRLSAAAACAIASYALVADLIVFALVQVLVTSLRMGKRIGENALISAMEGDSTRLRAVQRSAQNIGISVGTLIGALPLQLGTRSAYVAAIFFTSATLAVGAVLLRKVPDTARVPLRTTTRRHALWDRRYVAVGLLIGLLEVRDSVLVIAMPLWVAATVPTARPLIAVLLLINTVMVVVLQVWSARGASGVRGAAVTVRRGGVALGLSCAVIGSTVMLPPPAAAAALMLATICFTLGEMWAAAGGWTLSYDLADPRSPGQYQGVFQTTSGIGLLVGPIVATGAAVSGGFRGWVATGLGFALVGVLTARVALNKREGILTCDT